MGNVLVDGRATARGRLARGLAIGGVLAGLFSLGVSGAAAQGTGSPTLDAVKARGQLVCGINGSSVGFSLPDSNGVMQGLDADGCKAVAAAIFGDPTKVKFAALTTETRFTALQSGQVDLLIRNTTWTLGRESTLGLEFAGINWYDGTGFLVKKASGVKSAKELDGASVCVAPGTSTELAIADYFRSNKLKYTPILIADVNEVHTAFLNGRCDAFSDDASSLAAFRFSQGPKADDLSLLPEIISKEPLGPVVRKGDDKWFDIVRWTYFGQNAAEELGVNSKNVDAMLKSEDPSTRRLLGVEGDLGKSLGLDNKWLYNVIKTVGNTGEVWDKDITPLGVPRGINNLWTKGGLQYSPPLR
jgi:general L-amino acid transport system substrate-binding protein